MRGAPARAGPAALRSPRRRRRFPEKPPAPTGQTKHPRHPGFWKMLAVATCVALLGCLQAQELQGHVSIILLGATGDLARKYLWQGLFQLYLDEAGKGHSFSFHGAALTTTKQGQEIMAKVLESLSCPKDVAPGRCAELKDQFQGLSRYRQLRTPEDYAALSEDVEALVRHEGRREAGRLFYFSVPPFAYADIARSINSSCRPGPGAWLRVVLEKPFGHDHRSAQQLAAELGSFFQEEEMYRVDHYLGKQAVAQILPFRDQNRKALDGLWNRHHVERVEIIMKETVDAEAVLLKWNYQARGQRPRDSRYCISLGLFCLRGTIPMRFRGAARLSGSPLLVIANELGTETGCRPSERRRPFFQSFLLMVLFVSILVQTLMAFDPQLSA